MTTRDREKTSRAFHETTDEATARAESQDSFATDGAVVIVLSGAAKGQSFRVPGAVGARVTVGKSRDNDLALSDTTVSRKHFAIERTSNGLRVVDTGSTNGLWIGGASIREAFVQPGTIVRAGDVELLIGVEVQDAVPIAPSARSDFGLAVGTSLAMRRIFATLERIAPTPANVLLIGETGTGKDVLARSIHMKSTRAEGPFEVLDCGAVTATLLESELFGHERGAFTGAVSSRAGAFERAAGGTLFLDEIGELPLDLQPKLLRVLEAREVRRVGGSKTISADVRIVAATTRDLRREAQRGAFRDDLYYRLSVVAIDVPPLRRRLDDIALLATRILENTALSGGPPARVPEGTMAMLKAYDWPGNVRELRNVLERAVHMAGATGDLRLVDFPPRSFDARDEGAPAPLVFDEFPDASYRDLRARVEASFERHYVAWLLERHDGNVSAAARHARMDRNHLTDLARRHGLEHSRKRGRPPRGGQ